MAELDIRTIRTRSIHGILALVSRAFFINVLSYIASLVIFTYLSPSEVGIYVAVIAMQRIISFITDFGFGAALVQKKEQLAQSEKNTAFTVQLIVTFSIFLIIFLLKDAIGSYFNLSESGIRLLLVLVFTIFLSTFKVIPSILLERHIKFHKLIIPQIIESVVFNFLLIFLVIQGFSIDSYSIAFLISSLVGIPFYYVIIPWSVSLQIEQKALRNLRYGIQFQAKNILATIKDDFLTVFLAKVLPFAELGYIGFGQRNAFFVYRYIVDSVTKVTFSTFARLQEDKHVLGKTIEKSLFYVTLVVFPLTAGIIVIAPYVVAYFPKWQNKWEPALISLMFFCANALVSSISGILVNVLDATGRVKTTLKLMVLWTTLVWVLTPIMISLFGYHGVSVASFLVTLSVVLTIYLVKSTIDFSFLNSILAPTVATVIMAICTYVLGRFFVHNIISLIATIIISGFVYSIVMYGFCAKTIIEDIKHLK